MLLLPVQFYSQNMFHLIVKILQSQSNSFLYGSYRNAKLPFLWLLSSWDQMTFFKLVKNLECGGMFWSGSDRHYNVSYWMLLRKTQKKSPLDTEFVYEWNPLQTKLFCFGWNYQPNRNQRWQTIKIKNLSLVSLFLLLSLLLLPIVYLYCIVGE